MSDHAMTDLTEQPDQPDPAEMHEHDGHEREQTSPEPNEHAGADLDGAAPDVEPADAESRPVEADDMFSGEPDALDALDPANGSGTPDVDLVGGSADDGDVVEAGGPDDTDDAAGTDGAEGTDDVDGAEGAPRRGNRVRLLEKEGEVAADFLERLLDIADLDGDIEVDIDGDRAAVAIVDSEDGRVPRRLVGAEGKVLDALQELTRLAVQAETGERSRLMLDVAGHRAQRRVQLIEVARTAIAEVKTTGQRTALEDMSAFERKIVHDEVAAAGLDSESEGVEPHRHIVVFPA